MAATISSLLAAPRGAGTESEAEDMVWEVPVHQPLLPSQEDGLLAVHTSWTSISGCGKRRAEESTDG